MAKSNAMRKPASRQIKVADSTAKGAKVVGLNRKTQDTLFNAVSGMGTDKDKMTANTWMYTDANKAQLDAAYRSDWIARKIIDIPAYDATREWRTWQAESKDITKLTDLETSLQVQKKTMQAMIRARLYGGAAIIMGVNDGRKPEEPLDIESVKEGALKFLHVVTRYEISSGEIDWNLDSPYFGQPAYYTRSMQAVTKTAMAQGDVTGTNFLSNTKGGMVTIHPSRLIRFTGLEVPEWNMSNGWGDSVLQIVSDAVMALGSVSQSIASLVQEAKVDMVKIPELSERISNTDYENRLKQRFGLANTLKSIYSVLLLDKEEEWQRINATFTGMPEVLEAFMLMVCGAADIPATRFMGQSPKGLSATGESDTRNYYDKVSTEQEITVSPNIEPLDQVLQMSALGTQPDGLFYEWNPLWQMDDAQRADIEVKRSTVVQADVNMGLLDPMVLQKARENQLIESGFYPGLEQIIDEYGTDIDQREPPATPPQIDPVTGQPIPPDPNADPNAPPPKPANSNAPVPPGKAAPAGKNAPPAPAKAANDRAIEGMLKRMQDATTPRPLYVYRKVLNWQEIAAFYKKQDGINTTLAADMHVTVIYSKQPVDWVKVGEDSWSGQDDNGNMTIKAGGPRVMEKFGNALVLAFASSDLSYRHNSAEYRADASYDYEDYTPHITITYQGGAVDILNMPCWTGKIELGPEIFEPIKIGGFDPESIGEV